MGEEKKALYNLSFGHFVLDLYAAVLIPLYPYIAQRIGIKLALISLVIGIGHAASSVLQPFFGYISDRLQKRVFMFFGLIFSSIFIPLGFKAPNALVLTLCLILGMLGNAFYHPQVTSIIKDFYKEGLKLSGAIGLFLGLGTVGYALGPYLSTFFLQTLGEEKYPLIGLMGVITAFLLLIFVPKKNKTTPPLNSDFKGAIKEILKNRACLFLTLVTTVKAALIMSFGTYVPFLLKEGGFSITQTGLILTLFYIAGGVSMFFSAPFERVFKLKGMIILSFLPLLPFTALSVFFIEKSKVLSSLFFILAGFFVLLSAGVVLAHAQNLLPKHTGTVSGIIQGFTLAAGSLILIPLGVLGENFGVQTSLMTITSAAFILSFYTFKTKLI